MVRRLILAAGLAVFLAGCDDRAAATADRVNEQRTARYFAAVDEKPVPRGIFLRQMPKGADLHNHLDGSVYTENLIAWAAEDGLCLDRAALALVLPPCDPANGRPKVAETTGDLVIWRDLLASLSMRDFIPNKDRAAYTHFFDTFAKFIPATFTRHAEMIAEVANRAAAQNIQYLELMWSPGMDVARTIAVEMAGDLSGDRDFDAMQRRFAPRIDALATETMAYTDRTEAKLRDLMKCGTAEAQAGCAVTVQFIGQVIRTFPTPQVFAQSQLAYALSDRDPRFVAVNLVAPEHDPITLRDYDTQMRQLGFLATRYPKAQLTLHAGELTLGLVPPEDLRFHIRSAVQIAGAKRIGHGMDIRYEDDAWGLMAEMAAKKILVEINLSSNEAILGVKDDEHPFTTYWRAGVPVALSTDDEGVSRNDLTHEFERAVASYHLTYAQLKILVRNSLEYAFLPGDSLWASSRPFRLAVDCSSATLGSDAPPVACKALLDRSERARQQWQLEARFARFEATKWPMRP